MKLNKTKINTADIEISRDELVILNNSLNEVCNALDQFDFETRMGVSREEVAALLSQINSIVDALESSN